MTQTLSNIDELACLMSHQIDLFRHGKYDQAIDIFAQTHELSNSLSQADLPRIRDLLDQLNNIIDAELAQTGSELANIKTARRLLQKYRESYHG